MEVKVLHTADNKLWLRPCISPVQPVPQTHSPPKRTCSPDPHLQSPTSYRPGPEELSTQLIPTPPSDFGGSQEGDRSPGVGGSAWTCVLVQMCVNMQAVWFLATRDSPHSHLFLGPHTQPAPSG